MNKNNLKGENNKHPKCYYPKCCSKSIPFDSNFWSILLNIVLIEPVNIIKPIKMYKRHMLNGFGSAIFF